MSAPKRNSRFFGRQFKDCVERPPIPEPTGLNRNKLNYKYPKPAGNIDTQIWRHPDYCLPPYVPPQPPPYLERFTHLCYDHQDLEHTNNNQDVPYPDQSNIVPPKKRTRNIAISPTRHWWTHESPRHRLDGQIPSFPQIVCNFRAVRGSSST